MPHSIVGVFYQSEENGRKWYDQGIGVNIRDRTYWKRLPESPKISGKFKRRKTNIALQTKTQQ